MSLTPHERGKLEGLSLALNLLQQHSVEFSPGVERPRDNIKDLFRCTTPVSHYTVDGHHLAPYPDMTDEDLRDYGRDMKVPNPAFP